MFFRKKLYEIQKSVEDSENPVSPAVMNAMASMIKWVTILAIVVMLLIFGSTLLIYFALQW